MSAIAAAESQSGDSGKRAETTSFFRPISKRRSGPRPDALNFLLTCSSSVIEQLPSAASRDYGVPFGELFRRHGGDFYKIDPLLFSPAEIAITNSGSGRTFRAGGVRADLLMTSLFA